jgi:arabinose-5-phosphate isomerase
LRHTDKKEIVQQAKTVLKIEAEAILGVMDKVDDAFVRAVEVIHETKGKVIVTGMGKSGLVGRKVASTLASTGTPAFFLHSAEAYHGDMGMANKDDIFLIISNSGETEEIVKLLPIIRRLGAKLISLIGSAHSTLAKRSDIVLDVGIEQEACSLGLAPTASSTVAMAMGDALAVALLERRGFSRVDFATLHPGGSLGRKLLLQVKDLMHTGDAIPMVQEGTLMRDALFEITSKTLGVTGVSDHQGILVGVITDGDLRRAMAQEDGILNKTSGAVMTRNPKWIEMDALAVDALNKMQRFSITSLFVFESSEKRRLEGIIQIHDLLRAKVL